MTVPGATGFIGQDNEKNQNKYECSGKSALNVIRIFTARERLNTSTFHGEPAQLWDAGPCKIKCLLLLILPQKFSDLFNRCLPRNHEYINTRLKLSASLQRASRIIKENKQSNAIMTIKHWISSGSGPYHASPSCLGWRAVRSFLALAVQHFRSESSSASLLFLCASPGVQNSDFRLSSDSFLQDPWP